MTDDMTDEKKAYLIISLYALLIIFLVVIAAALAWAGDVQQAVEVSPIDKFMVMSNTDKFIYLIAFASPGVTSIVLTMLWTRIKRAMYLEEHGKHMTSTAAFNLALKSGAVFGVLCLLGMQFMVNFIFSFPFIPAIVIGQSIMAVIATGLLSVLSYEALRMLLGWRYHATGNPGYRAAFNWLSIKTDKQGKPLRDVTQLFAKQDPTQMAADSGITKEDITVRPKEGAP